MQEPQPPHATGIEAGVPRADPDTVGLTRRGRGDMLARVSRRLRGKGLSPTLSGAETLGDKAQAAGRRHGVDILGAGDSEPDSTCPRADHHVGVHLLRAALPLHHPLQPLRRRRVRLSRRVLPGNGIQHKALTLQNHDVVLFSITYIQVMDDIWYKSKPQIFLKHLKPNTYQHVT